MIKMALILGMTLVFSPTFFNFVPKYPKKRPHFTTHCAHMFPVVKMQHNSVAEFAYFFPFFQFPHSCPKVESLDYW